MSVSITDLNKYSIQMPYLPPTSYSRRIISCSHGITDKVPAQNGDKFWSIFSDNLQPIATRGKKARGTLLVDKHCGTAVPLSAHLSPLVITTKLAAAILGGPLFGRGVCRPSTAPVVSIINNRKSSHTGFRLISNSVTLNDLERRWADFIMFFRFDCEATGDEFTGHPSPKTLPSGVLISIAGVKDFQHSIVLPL